MENFHKAMKNVKSYFLRGIRPSLPTTTERTRHWAESPSLGLIIRHRYHSVLGPPPTCFCLLFINKLLLLLKLVSTRPWWAVVGIALRKHR